MSSPLFLRTSLSTVLALALISASPALADEGWPKQVPSELAEILIYQPQLDTFENNVVTARAAVSVKPKGGDEPSFGAVWLNARLSTDRDDRMAVIEDLEVPRVRFAGATPEAEQNLAKILETTVPQLELEISLDRLLTSLELAERRRAEAADLETTPPRIVFAEYPTILISIDGKPELQAVDGADAMRVVNTPFLILFDTQGKRYYLDGGGELWYVAGDVAGPWESTETVPSHVEALRPPEPKAAEVDPEADPDADLPVDERIPNILVATEPTELIVSDGAPKYTPLDGNELLYLSNTDSDVLLEVGTQRYFVVLSGRWYVAAALEGPWTFVPADELPASFAGIPPESDMGHLLVFVAGTDQAEDAVMDAQIPQTSAVKRSETSLTVTYDGKPEWVEIEDSPLSYASNTGSAVFRYKNRYYACDQGVWFVSDDALGPWAVADEVPKEIYAIPASCPHYNVKYVYVYDSTPEVVYVGYLPGYTGSYVYQTTVVYGTGYYYPGWHGTAYYARPATWGFHVRYNPWFGWSFGFSYSTGPFRFTIGFGGRGGWWGPVGFRPYYRGYHHGYRRGVHAGYRAGYRAGQRDAYRNNNLYNKPENRGRSATPSRTGDGQASARTASNQPNNVFADKDGNVYRRNDDGNWQQRDGGGWKEANVPSDRTAGGTGDRAGSVADRTSQGSGSRTGDRAGSGTTNGGGSRTSGGSSAGRSSSPSSGSRAGSSGSYGGGSSNLNRDYSARQRGSSRSQSYSGSRSGGASRSRGGGGRRR